MKAKMNMIHIVIQYPISKDCYISYISSNLQKFLDVFGGKKIVIPKSVERFQVKIEGKGRNCWDTWWHLGWRSTKPEAS